MWLHRFYSFELGFNAIHHSMRGGILQYVRGATPCYTQVCGVVQGGGGRNPGGCSKAESRSTTATMETSANGHPCDITGSTCSTVGRGATLGLDTSVWCSAVWWQTAVQYVRGATPLLYTGVWCSAVWWWQPAVWEWVPP